MRRESVRTTRRTWLICACAVLLVGVLTFAGTRFAGVALADDDAGTSEESGETTAYSIDEPPELSSVCALLVDRTTGLTLYSKNADSVVYPASTTKIITALLVLENVDDLDEEVTVEASDLTEVAAGSSLAGLIPGETYTVRDLLAGLLIPSGNDASYVLARYVGGGDWQAFVDMMNERAAELGCTNTHFVNPCGLHDDDHYSTAHDLAIIFEAALAHPEFSEISSCATWDLAATSQQDARTLENTNNLVDPESPVYMGDTIVAGKTGSTWEAGRCLVVEACQDGMDVIGVVLGAPMEEDENGVTQSSYDMRSLLEWCFGAWTTTDVVAAGDVISSVGVTLSSDGEAVDVAAGGVITTTVPSATTLDDLTIECSWSGDGEDGTGIYDADEGAFRAPLEEGNALGTASVYLGDRLLGEVGLVAAEGMGVAYVAYALWWLTSEPIHAVIVAVCVALLFIVIGSISAARSRARRARRAQRARMDRTRQPMYASAPASRSRARRGATPRHNGSHMRR